jgi:aminoglycoside 3-N-acetyltransferase
MRKLRRSLAPAVTAGSLALELRQAGIVEGDCIMVHSSLSSMTNVEGGAETVIAALMNAVTTSGTILMPAFSTAEDVFEASRRGEPVDLRTMGSVNGKITSVFARLPGVLRSSHPFSSVCVWGAHAKYFTSGHHFDERIAHKDSPMGRLLQAGGKIVGIGTTMGPVSFYHVLDDTWDDFPLQPYAAAEPITYLDASGSTVTRAIARYDREKTKVRIDNDLGIAVREFMTHHMRERGIRHDFALGGANAFWLDVRAFYDELHLLAQDGLTIYSSELEVRAFEHNAENSRRPGVRSRAEPGGRVGLRS